MKIIATGYLADQIGEAAGEVIDFYVTPTTAQTVFRVVWYGRPGIHEVAPVDVEAVR